MYLLGDDNCMLSVPFSTSDLHLLLTEWRKLPRDGCRSFCDAQLRTVVFSQRRMISFLFSLAVLPTCCLLHDSRLFGLALRLSAPVRCCHQGFLGAREAGIFAGSRALSSFSPRLVLHVMARALWFQAACEYFLLKR